MGLSIFTRDSWFFFRLAMTGLLAGLLVFGRLPMAGATEEPVKIEAAEVGESGDAVVTGHEPEPEVVPEPTEEAVPTEEPEPEVTEAPAPEETEPAPVAQKDAEEPAPKDEPKHQVSTSPSPRNDAHKVAAAESVQQLALAALLPSTPAANPGGSLEQWANLAPTSWQNGNLNSGNSTYAENDSVPFRLTLTNLGGTPLAPKHVDVGLSWDILRSGNHAYDYLTSHDRTDSPSPCAGFMAPCPAPFEAAIPADSAAPGAGQIPGVFRAYGAEIDSTVGMTYATIVKPQETSRTITVRVVATGNTAVLAWGAHIAYRFEWSPEPTAAKISGSSYHMALTGLNGSGGSQDRSLSAGAVLVPGVELTKTVLPTSATVGDTVTYSYKIKNTGETDLKDLALSDDKIPSVSTLIPAGTTLAIGAETTYTKTYTLQAADVPSLTNVGTVNAKAVPTDEAVSDTDDATVTVAGVPGLSIDKTARDGAGAVVTSAVPGDTFNYVIRVTNTGSAAATNVTVNDVMPTGMTAGQATWAKSGVTPATAPATGNCGAAAQTVACGLGVIGNLAPGETVTVTVPVTVGVAACGPVENEADADATNTAPVATTDTTDSNVTVNCAPVLSISKSARDTAGALVTSAVPGDTFNYVVTVTNSTTATAAATDVTVNDVMPTGMTAGQATWAKSGVTPATAPATGNCGPAAQTVACGVGVIGNLAIGETVTVTIPVTVGLAACGPVENDADADATNHLPVATTNSTDSNVTVNCAPVLSISKSARDAAGALVTTAVPGDTFNYVVTVTNSTTATAAATDVTVNDAMPTGMTAGQATWAKSGVTPATAPATGNCGPAAQNVACGLGVIGNLAIGETVTVTIPVTVGLAACGPVENEADADATNHAAIATTDNTDSNVTVNCAPILTIDKSARDAAGALVTTAVPGDTFNYVVTVTNTSAATAAATDVTVDDIMPTGMTAGQATWAKSGVTPATAPATGNCGPASQTVACGAGVIGNLAIGETVTVTIPVTVELAACGPVENDAAADATNHVAIATDANTDSNVTVNCAPVLSISKSARDAAGALVTNAVPGDTFNYVVTVTNSTTATAAATDVTVNDVMPTGMTAGQATWAKSGVTPATAPATGNCGPAAQTVACGAGVIGNLAIGETVTVTIPVTVELAACGPVENDAAADATNHAPVATDNTNDSNVQVDCAPILTIDKSARDSAGALVTNAVPGDTFNYVVTVTNTSAATAAATDVTVDDIMPTGMTAGQATWVKSGVTPATAPATGNCGAAAQTVACATGVIGNLAIGETVTVTIPVTVGLAACGAVENDADAEATNHAPVATDNTNDSNVQVDCAPILTIDKSARDAAGALVTTAVPGDTFNYVVTVTNTSAATAAATDVTVDDIMPTGMTAGQATWAKSGVAPATAPATGNCGPAAQMVACGAGVIGNLAIGETVTVTIPVTVDLAACGPVENDAAADATNHAAIATDDNTDSNVQVDCAPILTIDKSARDAAGALVTNAVPGDTFNYVVTVTNTSAATAAATDVTVDDAMPTGMTAGQATWAKSGVAPATAPATGNCGPAAQMVACGAGVIGNLAIGETVTVTIPVTVELAACGPVENDAAADATNHAAIATDNNNDSNVQVDCAPILTIDKSARDAAGALVTNAVPGDTFNYVITVTNAGTATAAATDVTVDDTMPTGMTAGQATWAKSGVAPATAPATGNCGPAAQIVACGAGVIGNLAIGETVTVTIPVTVELAACGPVENDAAADATNHAPIATDANTDSNVQVDCAPSLTHDKAETSTGPYVPGDEIEWTVTVNNVGTASALNVEIGDDLANGLINVTPVLTVAGVVQPAADCTVTAGNVVTCDVGTLGVGETATMVVTADATTNSCGILSNTATVDADHLPAPEDTNTVDVTVDCAPAVTLAKSASASPVDVGDPYSYTIVATNAGTADATAFVLSDDLDDDLLVVDATYDIAGGAQDVACAIGAGNTVDCGPVDLAHSGGKMTATINVEATFDACGSVDNTASSNYSPDSNTVTVVIPCPAPSAIELEKTASAPDPDLGGVITYTYKITNIGGRSLDSITLVDDKLGVITLVDTDLAPGESTSVDVDHVITNANVDAGSLTNVATTTGIDPSGTTVTSTDTASVDLPQRPGIEVVKSADRASVDVGETITYTYVVTNTGNVTLTDISVLDDVIGVILDGAVGRSLGAGESLTLTSPYLATDADGVAGGVTNVATVAGTPPGGVPTTNTDTVTVPVGVTEVEPTGFLTVRKIVAGDGENQAYRFTVDCAGFELGKESSFTLPAKGGSHQIGVAIEAGTACKVVETAAGGADSTTVSINGGPDQTSRSAVATIRQQGSSVVFTNTFDAAPVDEPTPRPLPPSLPATGGDVNVQLIVAMAALLMGGTLVRVTRPRRRGWLRA